MKMEVRKKKQRKHYYRSEGIFWIPRSIRDHVNKLKTASLLRPLDLSTLFEQNVEIDVINTIAREIEELNIVEQVYAYIVNINKTLRESLPALLLSGFLSLFAGYFMTFLIEKLEKFPGLFVLIVPIVGLRGAASSSFASRLNSAYHLGLIKGEIERCLLPV